MLCQPSIDKKKINPSHDACGVLGGFTDKHLVHQSKAVVNCKRRYIPTNRILS